MDRGSGKAAVADFGLSCRDTHSRLTYRAVDLGVSVCMYGALLLLPVILPIVTPPLGAKANPARDRIVQQILRPRVVA